MNTTAAIEIMPMGVRDLTDVIALGLSTPELQDEQQPDFFDRQMLTDWLGNPMEPLYVARHQQQVLGFIIASFQPQARIGYIYDLAIDPAWRGAGLGRRLLEAVMTQFRQQRAREIWCLVHEANPAARSLFESFGLRRGRRFDLHIWTDFET